MKAAMVFEPLKMEIIEMDQPTLESNTEVRVKVMAAGICGSDVHIYHGTSPVATYPRVLGHEIVGVIEEVGNEVDKLKIGDRVIIDQVMNCGECYACKMGRGNVCHNLKVRGVHVHGGYREYINVDQSSCYVLPEKIAYTDAVMIEPATIAVQSLHRAELKKEDTLLIMGAGALGSSILKVARLSGAKIIVADIFDDKLKEALASGADYVVNVRDDEAEKRIREITDGYGVTVSVDAACTKDTLPFLLNVTGNAGRVITMGFSEEISEVTQLKITAKELDVRGSRLQNKRFQEVLDLIEADKLDLTGAVSHVYRFADIQKAFDLIDSGDPNIRKIVISFA